MGKRISKKSASVIRAGLETGKIYAEWQFTKVTYTIALNRLKGSPKHSFSLFRRAVDRGYENEAFRMLEAQEITAERYLSLYDPPVRYAF